jgi:hypothetical protein
VKLKLRKEYDLTEDRIAEKILSLTNSILGDIVDLVVCLAVDAIKSGKEMITLKMLSKEHLKELGWVPPSSRCKYDR